MEWERRNSTGEVLFGKQNKQVLEYDELYKRYTGRDIRSAKVVEIGFGARPFRLATFHAKNINAFGIDLDMPVFDGSLNEFLTVYRKNGFERALKSIVRHYLTGRSELKKFKAFHGNKGVNLNRDNLIVGNTTSVETWDRIGEVDLITSEDVRGVPPGAHWNLG